MGEMTDGGWQGGSVTRTLRRGPCMASRHDRGRRAHEGASAGAAAGTGAGADMMAWGDALGVVARQRQRAVAKTGDEVTAGGPEERQKSRATEVESDRSSEDEDSTGGCLREGWEPGRDDVDLSGRAGDGIGWNR